MAEPGTDLDRPDARTPPPADAPPPPGPRTTGPWLVTAALTAVLLLAAGRYGYHRDELYFLLCGRHLDWGYVDQGPLVPALAFVCRGLRRPWSQIWDTEVRHAG